MERFLLQNTYLKAGQNERFHLRLCLKRGGTLGRPVDCAVGSSKPVTAKGAWDHCDRNLGIFSAAPDKDLGHKGALCKNCLKRFGGHENSLAELKVSLGSVDDSYFACPYELPDVASSEV